MRIQLLSDLHIEANPDLHILPAAGADLLVLAGDIGSYQIRNDGSRLPAPDWGLQQFSPLPQYGGWPVPVVYVPGNHEYDALDFDQAHDDLRRTCDRLGLVWLEREQWQHGGVRFVGTTLWADFDALAHGLPGSQALKARAKAFRAANYYLRTLKTQRAGALFDAAAMREHSLVCQQWLSEALEQHFDGPTVVVTHFAPSLRSADPRYGLAPGTAGFCNHLDHLLNGVDLWLHGHLHCAHDYNVNGCRVVANPVGYAHKGEQRHFQPHACIDVVPSGTKPQAIVSSIYTQSP